MAPGAVESMCTCSFHVTTTGGTVPIQWVKAKDVKHLERHRTLGMEGGPVSYCVGRASVDFPREILW